MAIDLEIVHVFIDEHGRHGSTLGIIDAAAVAPSQRQSVASRSGLAATVFVELPDAGATSARTYIFGPQSEFMFAGQPMVGMAWWLTERGTPVEVLHCPAGPVEVRQNGKLTWAKALAEWAPQFSIVPLESPEEVDHAHPNQYPPNPHYLWSWIDELDFRVRARMFAPHFGIEEDEATGGAAARLTMQLRHALLIEQGNGSILHTMFAAQGWVEVGGMVRAGRMRSLPAIE